MCNNITMKNGLLICEYNGELIVCWYTFNKKYPSKYFKMYFN